MIINDGTDGSDKAAFTRKYFTAIVVCIIAAVIFACFRNGISGNDYWWHIKVGEWIYKNRQIPKTDIFSWYGTAHSIPWTAHEWLAEVIFYGIHILFGEIGVYLFSLLANLLFMLLIVKLGAGRLFKTAIASAVFLILFAATSTIFFYGRPHIFSIFLLFFELRCLYAFSDDQSSRAIWFIPLIGCLWSNLHGGSSNLSYILCILFLCADIIGRKAKKSKMSITYIRTMSIVTALTLLSILINPIGPGIFTYPYANMSDTFMLSIISEWAAPDAKEIGQVITFFIPLFMVYISLIITRKRIRLIDVALLAIFTFFFFRSVRFIIYLFTFSAFIVFDYFPETRIDPIRSKLETIGMAVPIALSCLCVILSVVGAAGAASRGTIVSTALDGAMIDIVKSEAPKRILNDYNLGETLIYNDLPVFIDSRADVYATDGLLKDAISLMDLQNVDGGAFDIDAILDKYDFDGFLILRKRPLFTYLYSHSERYDLVSQDEQAAYFTVKR